MEARILGSMYGRRHVVDTDVFPIDYHIQISHINTNKQKLTNVQKKKKVAAPDLAQLVEPLTAEREVVGRTPARPDQ